MGRKSRGKNLDEALKSQYVLRSAFIHKKLKARALEDLGKAINSLKNRKLNWDTEALAISKTAFKNLKEKYIPPYRAFCHPNVIIDNPKLVLYYRGLSGRSQKGLSKLATGIAGLEEGKVKKLAPERAKRIAEAVNRIISTIIDGDVDFRGRDIEKMIRATYGITLDGSWRNEIGVTASKQVQEMLLKFIQEYELEGDPALLEIALEEGDFPNKVKLRNDHEVIFGSEPDIAIHDEKGTLIVSIEVKGGIDDAGALERYGAARKSFDEARKKNVRCHTIYLTSCITPTVAKRIDRDGLVSQIQNLTEILFDDKERFKFLRGLFKYQLRLNHIK